MANISSNSEFGKHRNSSQSHQSCVEHTPMGFFWF